MNLGPVSKTEKKQLAHMLKHQKFSRIHDRIRVVLWGIAGETAHAIAVRLGRDIRWVQIWSARFRDEGIKGLFDRPKPGVPQKLPSECHEKFIARIKEGPLPVDEVSILHGKEIQRILRDEFHCEYSVAGVYALLHRLRFSWITPRPVHEKNDAEVMRAWLGENPKILAEEKKTSGNDDRLVVL